MPSLSVEHSSESYKHQIPPYYCLLAYIKENMPAKDQEKSVSLQQKSKVRKSISVQNIQVSRNAQNKQVENNAKHANKAQQQSLQKHNQNASNSISSSSSAFWPFTHSFEQNCFLSHIVSKQPKQSEEESEPEILEENFVNDPTQKVYRRLKKTQVDNSYEVEEIVLAKCINEPLWPGRIISKEKVSGLDPGQTLYKVKFINENTHSFFQSNNLVKLTQQAIQQLRKVVDDKKLLRAIKLAEKYHEEWEAEKELSQESIQIRNQEKLKELHYKEDTQVELSLSSFQQTSCKINKEQQTKIKKHSGIQVSGEGFYTMKSKQKENLILSSKSKHRTDQENKDWKIINQKSNQITEEKNERQDQLSKIHKSVFRPIVLFKGENLEINLRGVQKDEEQSKQQKQQEEKQSDKVPAISSKLKRRKPNIQRGDPVDSNKKEKPASSLLKIRQKNRSQEKNKHNSVHKGPKPINLVLQTPKLNSQEYYLNKIIVKFNNQGKCLNKFSQNSSVKDVQIDLDETILEENTSTTGILQETTQQLRITKQVKSHTTNKLTKKQLSLQKVTKTTSYNFLSQVKTYLKEILEDLQEQNVEITQRSTKQKKILQCLSLPLKIYSRNYLLIDSIFQLSVKIIKKFECQKKNEHFAINLRHKLKLISEFLASYREDNQYIKRLARRSLQWFDQIFKTPQQGFAIQSKPISSFKQVSNRVKNSKTKQKLKKSTTNSQRTTKKTEEDQQIASLYEQNTQGEESQKPFRVNLKNLLLLSYDESIQKVTTSVSIDSSNEKDSLWEIEKLQKFNCYPKAN